MVNTKKASDRDKGFGGRQDVLNKTLLRSLKKFITSQFDEQTNFSSLSFKEKKAQFKQLLEQFVSDFYEKKVDESNINSPHPFTDVLNYVGILINPELMKKRALGKKYAKFNLKYYD
jgi:hypothetical protein